MYYTNVSKWQIRKSSDPYSSSLQIAYFIWIEIVPLQKTSIVRKPFIKDYYLTVIFFSHIFVGQKLVHNFRIFFLVAQYQNICDKIQIFRLEYFNFSIFSERTGKKKIPPVIKPFRIVPHLVFEIFEYF